MSNQPVAYTGRTKYNNERSRKYQARKPGKHQAEMALIDRAFARIPTTHRVLDVPCGGGRVTIHLARHGYPVAAADLSDSMIAIARQNLQEAGVDAPVQKQDVEKLSLADRAVDAIVSFRLFHHFPNREIRQRVVRELCRVAAHHVILSYFSPVSFTSAKNRVRSTLTGRPPKKFATALKEIEGYFRNCGYQLVEDFAQLPLVHTLHVAVFQRRGDQPT